MGIVSLFSKYKILGDLNKYSLILIYLGFSTVLLLAFSFLDLSYLIFNLIFLLISTYFVYFIVSKKRRARGYDFDGMFPLKEKEYFSPFISEAGLLNIFSVSAVSHTTPFFKTVVLSHI